MVVLKMGASIDTKDPVVTIDIDPQAPMLSGKYVFQLVVRDNDGAVSAPTTVTVVVLDNAKPTAIIDGPAVLQVPFGNGFTLTGKGSHANPPATLAVFTWTLVAQG